MTRAASGTPDARSLRPIDGPAAWRGRELAAGDGYRLAPAEIAELEGMVGALRRRGTPREQLTPDDVPLGGLVPAVRAWRDALARGRGFVLVRGLPVDRVSDDDAALAYWALGLHIGTPMPQNFLGETLVDIRDTGADPDDPSTRLYKTRVEQDFHKNSVIPHKRTADDDWDEPARKRHLLRLWLAAPDFDDGDEQLRRGITLGRSA